MVENRQLQQSWMPHHAKRRNKKTNEEKSCQKKELDRAWEKTMINIEASYQRWRELQDL